MRFTQRRVPMRLKPIVQASALVLASVACLAIYHQYRTLQQQATEVPQVTNALTSIAALSQRLDGLQKHGMQQHMGGWIAACVKQTLNDQGRRSVTEQYRLEIAAVAEHIGNLESGTAWSRVFRPEDQLPRHLLALRDRLTAEGKGADGWDCTDERTIERLAALRDALGPYAVCLNKFSRLDPAAVWRRDALHPNECRERLARLRFGDGVQSASATAPEGILPERVVPRALAEPDDGVVAVQANGRAERSFVVSPDGLRVAYVIERNGKQLVVADGQEGPAYDRVWTIGGGPVFSEDSQHLVYRGERDGKWVVVLDGREGPAWDTINNLALSAEGGHVAFVGRRGREWRLVLDGLEHSVPEGVVPTAVLSPNGARVAYFALGRVVVDGVPGPKYDAIFEPGPVFSADSTHVAYIARKETQRVVVVDGVESQTVDGILQPGVIFSPNSARVAYVAVRKGKQVAVVDAAESPEYDNVGIPVFSPDSKRLGYVAKLGKLRVVVDGVEGPLNDDIPTASLVFSPDSARVAYVARRGDTAIAVVDGREKTHEAITGEVVFSPDSRRTAYVARSAYGWYVDGVAPGRVYDEVVHGPVFSPDSAEVAYVARKQARELVVEHRGEHEPYFDLDERTLRFSADSKHLAYVAWKAGWRLVVDGTASAHRFPGFVPEASPRFDSPTRVHGLARAESGPGLVRLEVDVPSEPGVRAATR